MATELSEEEREQILQTIQMFEMITQTQPDDYQSYDVLKEAYLKLGREEEAAEASRKLAESYYKMGLYSSAMLECEGILNRDPNDAEILAMMGELEQKMQSSNNRQTQAAKEQNDSQATLVSTQNTKGASRAQATDAESAEAALQEHGNESFAKFLLDNELCDEGTVTQALHEVQNKYAQALENNDIGPALLQEIESIHSGTMDNLIGSIIDATRFAFIPLNNYEVDRQIVRMLPDQLTMTRLIVPFDLISRTLMVAVCNPFDGEGKEAAQGMLDYNIQWFIAKPNAMAQVLKDIFKR